MALLARYVQFSNGILGLISDVQYHVFIRSHVAHRMMCVDASHMIKAVHVYATEAFWYIWAYTYM